MSALIAMYRECRSQQLWLADQVLCSTSVGSDSNPLQHSSGGQELLKVGIAKVVFGFHGWFPTELFDNSRQSVNMLRFVIANRGDSIADASLVSQILDVGDSKHL